MLHLLLSVLVGFIVGLIARAVMPGAQHLGFLATSALGILGSLVGGVIGMLVRRPAPGAKFHPAGCLMSVICSVILLYLYIHYR